VALSLYLDDCVLDHRLVDFLLRAGHRVVRSTEVGLEGEYDEVHFRHAADNGLTILTKNPADFEALHNSNQQHSGILVVYQDNDARDMSIAEIVKAISNLEQAAQSGGDPINGKFHSLNDWRY
jgi:predicted nuclease of predicted toxin-antitoxin system